LVSLPKPSALSFFFLEIQMYEIYMKNVYSVLSDYTEELEKALTVPYDSYWFSPKFKAGLWDGRHHFLKIPSLKFPSGLLFIVEEYFNRMNCEYIIHDSRKNPMIWPLTEERDKFREKYTETFKNLLEGIELYDYQVDSIQEAIINERGILELPTGSGKTEIAAGIIKALNQRTLFLVHTKDLLHQTIERFNKRLNCDIGIVGDGKMEVDPEIIVATVQSIEAMMKDDFGFAKKFLNRFKILFLDECHHASAATWYKIAMFCHNAYYRFGMSGTPLRRDRLSNMRVMAATGRTIYKKPTRELIDSGYLSNIHVIMIDNSEEVLTPSMSYRSIYEDGIVRSEIRNQKIVDIAEMDFKNGNRVLILVRQIEHGKILTRMLVNRKHIKTYFLYGANTSWERSDIKNKFNREGGFVLIASPIFDEGVDLPEINSLIIGSGGKSEVKTIQKIGRGLRKKRSNDPLIVYDFIDRAKFLSEHSRMRMKIYEKEGFLEKG